MLNVSPEFKTAMQQPTKELKGYLELSDGQTISADNDLVDYRIEAAGGLIKTAMKKASITLLGRYDELLSATVDIYFGVKIASGDYEYILLGKFEVTEAKYIEDKGTTQLVAFDNMLKFYRAYSGVSNYPVSLYAYLQAVCTGVGVQLENTSIYNGDISVEQDYYSELPDVTFRDVLGQICEAAGSQAIITPAGKLELRELADTGQVLTYDNLLSLTVGDKWGGINSVVLAREPQNDDIYQQDAEDIQAPTTRNLLNLQIIDETYTQGGA